MIDGPSAIDPLVAAGPLAPVESLRPAPSLQRLVILDTPTPQMVDLEQGNVRPYENGPPVSIPIASTRFNLATLSRLQVQVLRDPRPSSVDSTLFSLHLAEAGQRVDIRETPQGKLVVDDGQREPVIGPIGASLAIVVVAEISKVDDSHRLVISARNAETMDSLSHELQPSSLSRALVTIGGPTTEVTGARGRRRTIPVLIDTARAPEAADQVRRAVRGAKRVAGSIRNRVT